MFRLRNVHLEEKRGWRGGRVLKFTSDVNLIQAIFLIWIAVKCTTKAIRIYRIPEREILNCRSQKKLAKHYSCHKCIVDIPHIHS